MTETEKGTSTLMHSHRAENVAMNLFFYLPGSYVSMTSGFLLFPVHRSLIKSSNEEVMHNFICSGSSSGHFLTSLKSMIVSFWKAIILPQQQALGSQMLNGPSIDSWWKKNIVLSHFEPFIEAIWLHMVSFASGDVLDERPLSSHSWNFALCSHTLPVGGWK